MKREYLKMTLLMTGLALGIASCEKKLPEIEKTDHSVYSEVPPVPVKNVPFESRALEETHVKQLARIQNNGYEYRFDLISDNNVALLTKHPDNTTPEELEAVMNRHKKMSLFELFISITDKDVAVPKSIANTADVSFVTGTGRTIDPSNANVTILDAEHTMKANRSCGDVGLSEFQSTWCFWPLESTPSFIEYCDPGTWTNHVRNSYLSQWYKHNRVFTATNVICGVTKINHSYWTGSEWLTWYAPSVDDGVWTTSAAPANSTKKYMSIWRERPQNTGSFRAYTLFYSSSSGRDFGNTLTKEI